MADKKKAATKPAPKPASRSKNGHNGQHKPTDMTPIELAPGASVTLEPLSRFEYDPNNLNDHTPRGHSLLTREVQQNGVGRSMFATADGVMAAGNLTKEVIHEVMGDPEAIVVRSDGTHPIIHVRTDIQSGDVRAQEMALADNWIASVSMNLNPAAVAALDPRIKDRYFFKEEVAMLLRGRNDLLAWQPLPDEDPMNDPDAYGDLHITVHELDQVEEVKTGLHNLFKRHPDWKAELR